jgi:flagellar protein FlbT
MKKPICISLRNGERIYVNGAVLRVDRKVTLELINDVTFLLESQVMQVADATTPLRQLYFVIQLMLMSPHDVEEAKAVYRQQRSGLLAATQNAEISDGRALFEIEQLILTGGNLPRPVEVA